MKPNREASKAKAVRPNAAWLVVWLMASVAVGQPAAWGAQASLNVMLWDTGSRLGEASKFQERAGWKLVPSDLLSLESDPPKARSDPGYYGREYVFQGDAVVESPHLAAVFRSAGGRVEFYSKAAMGSGGGSAAAGLGSELIQFVPNQAKGKRGSISRCEILRNAADEVVLAAHFSGGGMAESSAVFAFGRSEAVEIRPDEMMKGIRLAGSIDFGIVPSFVGDDLIFGGENYPSAQTLNIPSERFLIGLLTGADSEFVMTWPEGRQQVRLQLGDSTEGKRRIESIDFDPDGRSFFLAAINAPGIWHRESLTSAFLEKDVTIPWKRPFAARWKTELDEAGTKTTFAFRESKGEIWRGVPGSYRYPVWFEGENASYHLSKKIPPKGESIIYFLEGQGTPLTVATPVDILQGTLGRSMSASILDATGRKLRTHHRRGGDGVRRACTCGCTEAIQAMFEAGEEVTGKESIEGCLDDMKYFVRRHVERIEEYQRFSADLLRLLSATADTSPELKPYLASLEEIAQRVPQEYGVQKENMKSLAHADKLATDTMALTRQKDPNNVKAYMDLLKAWREMGGAQDYVLAQCHTITRKLCQEAGYGCVNQPNAAMLAAEIRARCRQCLRNPDGYEIWADY